MAEIEVSPRGAVTSARRVTIDLAATMTGLTANAIRGKIREGVWLEGYEYHRAPDGRIYIDIEGFESWVARGRG